MDQLRDRAIPVVAFGLVIGVGIIMLLLLSDARSSSLEALEEAKQGEVSALANSRNQSLLNGLNSVGFLAQQEWEFVVGSENDQEILRSYRSDDARTGFFLIDTADQITQGILIEGDAIGDTFDRPGWDDAKQSTLYRQGGGVILPVSDESVTTTQHTYAFVLPIFQREPAPAYVGAFVAEIDVSPEADINSELAVVQRADTDEYVIADENGTILAAADTGRLATPVAPEIDALPPGLHRVGDAIIAIEEIPRAGWRLIFTQSQSEFEEPLAQPLQNVGRILIVVILLVGAGVFLMLHRRLRAAREEQERLRRLNETQEEFISIVSHELRTPVAGVLGFLQTSLDHWDAMTDGERQATVRRAAVNARRLQALTRDVLDTQSVEAGRLTYVFERVDLAAEVGDSVEVARQLYPDHHIELSTPPSPVTVEADADRIQQVLTNLIDNAAKNAPTDTEIAVSVQVEGSEAVVTVTDEGPGLEPAAIERLFDKFVRGRTQTVTGTGLGLYISRRIIEAHGGSIGATSEPGRVGAEFRFTIPLAAAPAAGDREPAASP